MRIEKRLIFKGYKHLTQTLKASYKASMSVLEKAECLKYPEITKSGLKINLDKLNFSDYNFGNIFQ